MINKRKILKSIFLLAAITNASSIHAVNNVIKAVGTEGRLTVMTTLPVTEAAADKNIDGLFGKLHPATTFTQVKTDNIAGTIQPAADYANALNIFQAAAAASQETNRNNNLQIQITAESEADRDRKKGFVFNQIQGETAGADANKNLWRTAATGQAAIEKETFNEALAAVVSTDNNENNPFGSRSNTRDFLKSINANTQKVQIVASNVNKDNAGESDYIRFSGNLNNNGSQVGSANFLRIDEVVKAQQGKIDTDGTITQSTKLEKGENFAIQFGQNTTDESQNLVLGSRNLSSNNFDGMAGAESAHKITGTDYAGSALERQAFSGEGTVNLDFTQANRTNKIHIVANETQYNFGLNGDVEYTSSEINVAGDKNLINLKHNDNNLDKYYPTINFYGNRAEDVNSSDIEQQELEAVYDTSAADAEGAAPVQNTQSQFNTISDTRNTNSNAAITLKANNQALTFTMQGTRPVAVGNPATSAHISFDTISSNTANSAAFLKLDLTKNPGAENKGAEMVQSAKLKLKSTVVAEANAAANDKIVKISAPKIIVRKNFVDDQTFDNNFNREINTAKGRIEAQEGRRAQVTRGTFDEIEFDGTKDTVMQVPVVAYLAAEDNKISTADGAGDNAASNYYDVSFNIETKKREYKQHNSVGKYIISGGTASTKEAFNIVNNTAIKLAPEVQFKDLDKNQTFEIASGAAGNATFSSQVIEGIEAVPESTNGTNITEIAQDAIPAVAQQYLTDTDGVGTVSIKFNNIGNDNDNGANIKTMTATFIPGTQFGEKDKALKAIQLETFLGKAQDGKNTVAFDNIDNVITSAFFKTAVNSKDAAGNNLTLSTMDIYAPIKGNTYTSNFDTIELNHIDDDNNDDVNVQKNYGNIIVFNPINQDAESLKAEAEKTKGPLIGTYNIHKDITGIYSIVSEGALTQGAKTTANATGAERARVAHISHSGDKLQTGLEAATTDTDADIILNPLYSIDLTNGSTFESKASNVSLGSGISIENGGMVHIKSDKADSAITVYAQTTGRIITETVVTAEATLEKESYVTDNIIIDTNINTNTIAKSALQNNIVHLETKGKIKFANIKQNDTTQNYIGLSDNSKFKFIGLNFEANSTIITNNIDATANNASIHIEAIGNAASNFDNFAINNNTRLTLKGNNSSNAFNFNNTTASNKINNNATLDVINGKITSSGEEVNKKISLNKDASIYVQDGSIDMPIAITENSNAGVIINNNYAENQQFDENFNFNSLNQIVVSNKNVGTEPNSSTLDFKVSTLESSAIKVVPSTLKIALKVETLNDNAIVFYDTTRLIKAEAQEVAGKNNAITEANIQTALNNLSGQIIAPTFAPKTLNINTSNSDATANSAISNLILSMFKGSTNANLAGYDIDNAINDVTYTIDATKVAKINVKLSNLNFSQIEETANKEKEALIVELQKILEKAKFTKTDTIEKVSLSIDGISVKVNGIEKFATVNAFDATATNKGISLGLIGNIKSDASHSALENVFVSDFDINYIDNTTNTTKTIKVDSTYTVVGADTLAKTNLISTTNGSNKVSLDVKDASVQSIKNFKEVHYTKDQGTFNKNINKVKTNLNYAAHIENNTNHTINNQTNIFVDVNKDASKAINITLGNASKIGFNGIADPSSSSLKQLKNITFNSSNQNELVEFSNLLVSDINIAEGKTLHAIAFTNSVHTVNKSISENTNIIGYNNATINVTEATEYKNQVIIANNLILNYKNKNSLVKFNNKVILDNANVTFNIDNSIIDAANSVDLVQLDTQDSATTFFNVSKLNSVKRFKKVINLLQSNNTIQLSIRDKTAEEIQKTRQDFITTNKLNDKVPSFIIDQLLSANIETITENDSNSINRYIDALDITNSIVPISASDMNVANNHISNAISIINSEAVSEITKSAQNEFEQKIISSSSDNTGDLNAKLFGSVFGSYDYSKSDGYIKDAVDIAQERKAHIKSAGMLFGAQMNNVNLGVFASYSQIDSTIASEEEEVTNKLVTWGGLAQININKNSSINFAVAASKLELPISGTSIAVDLNNTTGKGDVISLLPSQKATVKSPNDITFIAGCKIGIMENIALKGNINYTFDSKFEVTSKENGKDIINKYSLENRITADVGLEYTFAMSDDFSANVYGGGKFINNKAVHSKGNNDNSMSTDISTYENANQFSGVAKAGVNYKMNNIDMSLQAYGTMSSKSLSYGAALTIQLMGN